MVEDSLAEETVVQEGSPSLMVSVLSRYPIGLL